MSDLVQWLRAQLDADERIARAATQGDWVWSREFVTPPGYHHRTIGPLEPGDAAYIAAWAPARVLRETDAKRWFVEMLANSLKPNPTTGIPRGVAWSMLMRMAEPYRDRPGWLPYWPGSG